ncbi:hypothetical protein K432DRAFT_405503 [Lepidopterella palustris CBS 459.81]|uniref:Matrin-type domain-containing protein n=1 Tax=Lepidopterella palustris CBS 459.81 TaxID=1314670 RepID=A0A8E2E953_9PEZI|nr:hypothetical protein K432DRAFT_405503 [Lepidopterella palustris CBS 459.81]
MILEDQRLLHEDLERLEQAIADRVLEEPKHIRDRLSRDHQIANFLSHIQDQSSRLLKIYEDPEQERTREIQSISTGDPFDAFYKELASIKDFHRRYPNEPVENLEKAYKRRSPEENAAAQGEIEAKFTGEEGYGRFFDMTSLHEEYLNLPGVKGSRRVTYLQYLDSFDAFTPPQCNIRYIDKMTDQYFRYLGELAHYLESFMRRTKPLEDLDKIFSGFDHEFEELWEKDEVPGWSQNPQQATVAAPPTDASGKGVWCAHCEKEFKNENVYKAHLTGKRHIKAAQARQARNESNGGAAPTNGTHANPNSVQRLKERAIAEREFRIRKLASAMQTERSDTRVNVERKQGMTDRERQQELAALYAEAAETTGGAGGDGDSDSEGEDKIYNPLKLPLAWDGKPIPFWLYKLHGLGVEFPCEICGNFVYMGRRAFDKHFNEPRHIYGLKCLGITNTTLFREITGIDDALTLWDKIQRDKKKEKASQENIVQMEDAEGNVMPEKVYYDLLKQGLL